MVGMDASVALALWFPQVPCSVSKARERVEHLVQNLTTNNERILIPSPALGEILVHAGSAGQDFINLIVKSSRIEIAPFDTLAAIEVALAIGAAKGRGNKRGKNVSDTWAKIKFDHQIVAICKVREIRVLYSDDPALCNFANSMEIETLSLADLPLPIEQPTLFDPVEDEVLALPAPYIELSKP